MNRTAKIFVYGFALLVAAGLAFGAWIEWQSHRRLTRVHAIAVAPVSVPAGAEAVARGKHLAMTRGCVDCHGANLAGLTVIDDGAMGRIDGPNLTRGAGGLPADYSDEDYIRAIRHGVNREGRGLFLMPSTDYATLSDADMGALIAYLRSVPAVDKPRGPVAPGPVAKALLATGRLRLAAQEIEHARIKPSQVAPAANAEYGRYVAASCTGCHGVNLSGGKIAAGPPTWPPAANLTPHPDGRLAQWTEADFVRAMRTQRRPDGSEISPVKPKAFGGLDDLELKALWAYLRTLPPKPQGKR
jgi:cytochrome c553